MPKEIKLSELTNYFDRQKEAHRALEHFKFILYGGAMGGGKSYWLRWELVRMLMRWYVKYQAPKEKEGKEVRPIMVGLFCEDYPALKDRQISKIGVEMAGKLGEIKDDHKEYGRCFRLYPEYGGGIILLRNLDDPSKYQCFKPGTEMLTKDGFKPIEDVEVDEVVPTFDPQTQEVTYQPVTKTWEYDFDGTMVETPDNKSLVAFSVTPNHKLVARTRRGDYKLKRADELPSEMYIPTNGSWSGRKQKTWELPKAKLYRKKKSTVFGMQDWLYFLGWYLSEGSLGDRKRYEIKISQRKANNKDKVRLAIENLGYTTYEEKDGVRFYGKSMFEYLAGFGLSDEKYIPREFLELAPDQLKTLFDSLLDGDGHVYKNGYARYISTSRQLIDDVSELCLKLGYTPTIIPTNYKKQRYDNAKPCWHLGIRDRTESRVSRKNLKRVPYKGKVYSVTVPPHYTIFTRYKNRISVSGQSAEFAAIAVDELTKNSRDSFDDLRNRLRWPALPAKEWKFISATNPGGVGHAWVKKKWMDGLHEETEQESDKFIYIPSKAKDNPHLEDAYIKSLEGLPEQKRKAFLEGDWNIFKGQYFTQWRNDVHVIKPFPIPEEWKKFICLDYGYTNPAAAYWCAVDYDGVIYVYRELYETNLTFKQLTDEIVARTPDDEMIDYWVPDPAIWQKRGEYEGGLSGADKMKSRYQELMKDKRTKNRNLVLKKGDNDRINGWGVLREYLTPFEREDETMANLQVFENCRMLIVTLPSLVYDERKVEDIDSNGEDHGADAIRYGVMSRPRPTETRDEYLDRWFKNKIKNKKSKGGVSLMRGY